MSIDMVTPTDPPQFEAVRFDETAEFGERDVPQAPGDKPVP
jgi:hypothetical protein